MAFPVEFQYFSVGNMFLFRALLECKALFITAKIAIMMLAFSPLTTSCHHNIYLCESVFYEVPVTSDCQFSSQFILRTFGVPDSMKFPSGFPEILHLREWVRREVIVTTKEYNQFIVILTIQACRIFGNRNGLVADLM